MKNGSNLTKTYSSVYLDYACVFVWTKVYIKYTTLVAKKGKSIHYYVSREV